MIENITLFLRSKVKTGSIFILIYIYVTKPIKSLNVVVYFKVQTYKTKNFFTPEMWFVYFNGNDLKFKR